jgi:hypothetical protein
MFSFQYWVALSFVRHIVAKLVPLLCGGLCFVRLVLSVKICFADGEELKCPLDFHLNACFSLNRWLVKVFCHFLRSISLLETTFFHLPFS